MLEIHSETVENLLVYFIKDTIYKNNFKNGIVGVSGGLDSAVTLALTQRALGSQHTFALLMPYKLSSKDSLEDGKKICELLSLDGLVVTLGENGIHFISAQEDIFVPACKKEVYDFSNHT